MMLRGLLISISLLWFSCGPPLEHNPLLVIAGPKDVTRIEVFDEEGETLWLLVAEEPRSLDSIHYFVVPSGFSQAAPVDGVLPRPLVPGEVLLVETRTLKRTFRHLGVASSQTRMEIVNYTMEMSEESTEAGVTGK